jgi:hypothetical protein
LYFIDDNLKWIWVILNLNLNTHKLNSIYDGRK